METYRRTEIERLKAIIRAQAEVIEEQQAEKLSLLRSVKSMALAVEEIRAQLEQAKPKASPVPYVLEVQ